MATARIKELTAIMEQISLATKPGQIQLPGINVRLFPLFNPKKLNKKSLPICKEQMTEKKKEEYRKELGSKSKSPKR